MSSLLAKITCLFIKAYTYKYRKNHLSLSKNVKLKNSKYNPQNFNFEILDMNDQCQIEKLVLKGITSDINIIHIHGGGPYQGMNNMYHQVAEKLAKHTHATVYSINYKPDTKYVYPILHNICLDACIELSKIIDFNNTIVIGDSFGANLILSTCHKLQSNGFNIPRKIILVSPFVDLAATGSSYEFNCHKDPMYALPKNQNYEDNSAAIKRKSSYIGNNSPFEPYLSPVYLEYNNFPPVLIQVGSLETDLSDSYILKSALENKNNQVTLSIYNCLFHDFQYFAPFLRESKKAWKEILDHILI